jgi:hypothetical protein
MTSARHGICLLLGLLPAFLPTSASAQKLYRCGNTFSQTPCGADAAAVRVPGAAAPTTASGSPGQVCAQQVVASLSANGGTARIDSVASAGTEVIQYANQPIAAHLYAVTLTRLDAKGREQGQVSVQCYLSEDDQRVLKVLR